MKCVQAAFGLALLQLLALHVHGTVYEPEEQTGNAALQYWLAFQWMPDVLDEKISDATTDDPTFGFAVPVSGEVAKVLHGTDTQQALTHLHRAAALSHCDWGIDVRKDGPYATSMELYSNKAWKLARFSCLRARWYFERGEWEQGLDDVIATMIMARDVGRQMLPYDHFCYLVENIALGTVAAYLPRMPPDILDQLSKRLDSLPTFSPMRKALLCYEGIVDWLIDNIQRAPSQGDVIQILADVSSPELAKETWERAGNVETLIRQAQEARPLLRQCADLMLLSPAECDRVFEEHFKPKLEKNLITALMAMNYPEERREDAQAHCRMVMLKTAIDVVRRGKAALEERPDPYGSGPFQYIPFDGGFELRSALIHHVPIYLVVGVRKN